MRIPVQQFVIFVFSLLFFSSLQSQTTDTLTKFDSFLSQRGKIVRSEDIKLQDIRFKYTIDRSRIRKLTIGEESIYFYQIIHKGEYITRTASIAYEDLLEVQRALIELKAQATADVGQTQFSSIQNRFATNDGFEVGYLLEDGKFTWYLELQKAYSSARDNIVFSRDFLTIEQAVDAAVVLIEQLMGSDQKFSKAIFQALRLRIRQ